MDFLLLFLLGLLGLFILLLFFLLLLQFPLLLAFLFFLLSDLLVHFPEFRIIPLQLLQIFLGLLRVVHVIRPIDEVLDVFSVRPIRWQKLNILAELNMQRLNIPSIPVSLPIELQIPAVCPKNLADRLLLMQDHTLEVITRMLLHLVEDYPAG